MPRRPLVALLAALGCAAGAAAVWFASFRVPFASWVDHAVLHGFNELQGPRTIEPASLLARSVGPQPFAVLGALLIVLALLRRRPRVALASAAILGGANVTTQALKQLAGHGPRAFDASGWGFMGGEVWPSGHTTAAMTLVLCAVLVAPLRLRPYVAAVGAMFAVAVVYSIMVLAWHLPSDVLGGFLVATGWTFLSLAALWAAERRWPTAARRERPPTTLGVLGPAVGVAAASVALVAAGAATLTEPWQIREHAVEHSAFVVGAPMIAAAALTLVTAVALAARR